MKDKPILKKPIDVLTDIHNDFLGQRYASDINRRVFAKKVLACKDPNLSAELTKRVKQFEQATADMDMGIAVCDELIKEIENPTPSN